MATTTPNYGWDVPTSTDYVKDGATAIETLGDDIDATLYTALGGAYPGLRLIKTQTVGTAVASVTVTNAFSATYENYKIVISGVDGSVVAAYLWTLGSTSTGYYGSQYYDAYTGASGTDRNNNAAYNQCGITAVDDNGNTSFDVINPFLAKRTSITGTYNAGLYSGWFGGSVFNTTSYTAFTITPASGTLTGGQISVYGYGKS
jgi:hypothetical protein